MMDSLKKWDAKLVEQSKKNIVEQTDAVFEMEVKSAKGALLFAVSAAAVTAVLALFHKPLLKIVGTNPAAMRALLHDMFTANWEVTVFFGCLASFVVFFVLFAISRTVVHVRAWDAAIETKTQWQRWFSRPGKRYQIHSWDRVSFEWMDVHAQKHPRLSIIMPDASGQQTAVRLDAMAFGQFSLEEFQNWLEQKKMSGPSKPQLRFSPHVLQQTEEVFEMEAAHLGVFGERVLSNLIQARRIVLHAVALGIVILILAAALAWFIAGIPPSMDLFKDMVSFIYEDYSSGYKQYGNGQSGYLFLKLMLALGIAGLFAWAYQYTDIGYIKIDKTTVLTKSIRDIRKNKTGTVRRLSDDMPLKVSNELRGARRALTVRTAGARSSGFSFTFRGTHFDEDSLKQFEHWLGEHRNIVS